MEHNHCVTLLPANHWMSGAAGPVSDTGDQWERGQWQPLIGSGTCVTDQRSVKLRSRQIMHAPVIEG